MTISKIYLPALMLLLIVPFLNIVSGDDYALAAIPLLDRIAIGEGTGVSKAQKMGYASGYDVLYGYQKPIDFDASYPESLTEMNLRQVKELQRKMSSSAIGRYQFLYSTLWGTQSNPTGGLVSRLGLSLDDMFNAETQDKLALTLLKDCGYSKWIKETPSDETNEAFKYKLAGIWASIENPYNPGRSRYRINGEPCTSTSSDCQSVGTTSEQISAAMKQARELFGFSQDAQNQVITLTLYVHDGSTSGPLIPGAQVLGQDGSGNSFYATTDSDGYVNIEGNPGTWSFSASASGYETNIWDQEITETDTKDAFLQEEQSSESSMVGKWNDESDTAPVTLTLYVHDGSASGPIIPGAQVRLSDGNMSLSDTTNSLGYITYTGDPGTWSFTVSADGYETNSWDQEITETDTKDAFLQEEQQREPAENSVVGKWAVQVQFEDIDIKPAKFDMFFYDDGTFETSEIESFAWSNHEKILVDSSTRGGKWTQNGNDIRWELHYGLFSCGDEIECIFDPGTITYEGIIIGDAMNGTCPTRYDQGYWSASRISTVDPGNHEGAPEEVQQDITASGEGSLQDWSQQSSDGKWAARGSGKMGRP